MSEYLDIGVISEGTHRPQDLLPALLGALRDVDSTAYAQTMVNGGIIPAHAQEDDDAEWWDSEDASGHVDALFDTLSEYAPPYCYFGSLEGDGACFGWFIAWDSINEAILDGDMLKVSDLSEVPDDWDGEVLHSNDHGNATLYARDMDQEFREVWAIV